MSDIDFQNGILVGMAIGNRRVSLGQILGVDFGITNDDTSSITIDFKIAMSDMAVADYINALFICGAYIEDQVLIQIKGWTRVNASTIKFTTSNYFSTNGVLTIAYNEKEGHLGVLPSFAVDYKPTGVPIICYKKESMVFVLAQNTTLTLAPFIDTPSVSQDYPVNSGLSESSVFSVTVPDLTITFTPTTETATATIYTP